MIEGREGGKGAWDIIAVVYTLICEALSSPELELGNNTWLAFHYISGIFSKVCWGR